MSKSFVTKKILLNPVRVHDNLMAHIQASKDVCARRSAEFHAAGLPATIKEMEAGVKRKPTAMKVKKSNSTKRFAFRAVFVFTKN